VQANARAESYADVIHKSLRIICNNQAEWFKHLQSIAYSYRASAQTNVVLSPYEIVFGQRMALSIDVSMGAPEATYSNLDAYYTEIGPKLEVLHQLAQQNASDSASRQRGRANQGAKLPRFKAGDKVLLYNPVTKTGVNPKLKVRYAPHIVIEARPGYTFRLQNLQTGVELKRAVHARRLRPLLEREQDSSVVQQQQTTVFEGSTTANINVKVVIGDILQVSADTRICFIDKDLLPVGESSDRLLLRGGADVIQYQLNIA
jgi:hypothetical protein